MKMHLNVPLYFCYHFSLKTEQAERLVWLVSSAGQGWEWVGLLLVFRATFFFLSSNCLHSEQFL